MTGGWRGLARIVALAAVWPGTCPHASEAGAAFLRKVDSSLTEEERPGLLANGEPDASSRPRTQRRANVQSTDSECRHGAGVGENALLPLRVADGEKGDSDPE